MKHSIAVKFIAVFLAALALFGAVSSAVGIYCLAAMDLYEMTVDELYEDSTESTRRHFAVELTHRYASLALGNLPESYLEQYHGSDFLFDTFQWGYFFYSIYDEQGNMVESTMADVPSGGALYRMEVTDIGYRSIVQNPLGVSPATEPEAVTVPEDVAMPEDAAEPENVTTPETTAEAAQPTQPESETIPEGSEPTQAVTSSAEATDPIRETGAALEEVEATMAALPVEASSEYIWDEYYDYETDQFIEFFYRVEELPPYTVELYLLPGAMPEEHIWSLLRQIWTYRNELFYVLGGSLLLFAILAVYLCCAAGRKPGREETRAGGLNCIPLDLYALCGGLVIFFALFLGIEAVEYLLRYSPQVLAPFVLLAGYGCCLIVVGFCFACAAQFKTPGGYWWRNSLVGRCLRLTVRLWNWFIRGCVWLANHLPPVLRKLFRWLLGCVLAIWAVAKKLLLALWTWIRKICICCGRKIVRFYGLIPLTWQWLLTAFVMIFLAFVAFSSYSGGWLLLCLGLYLAIVLYGTNAFGILMDAARRMGKGDLETKVSNQFLVGCFKEFAGNLNDLADVAVVAAQKQLKSERMKTELITNVSHDIKTPLTSIINYVDLLQKPHTPEEQETYLEVLSRQSLQLKKLIEDLMEMSKASTGNMTVDITAVNAGEAINQALGEFADKLEKIQLTPVFRQPEEPIYMKADGRLAWRVMSNLLSNAYKYALPGTRLYIDLMQLEGKVIISMKNISREELNVSADELLERFVRGDASRNTEGSGLGLNIAQSLMELQKGQLQLLVDGDLFKVTLVFPAAQI